MWVRTVYYFGHIHQSPMYQKATDLMVVMAEAAMAEAAMVA